MRNKEYTYQWKTAPAAIKRFFDILVSLIILIVFSPFYILIALFVLFTTGSPIFFTQVRSGKKYKEFKIIKYRTMHIDAEVSGPQITLDNDNRIVGFGKQLRKWRIDEFPQFLNVLKGDMSIVGPRPERPCYIHQIEERLPEYHELLAVKPGITSLGMVKFGYASTVEEMIERAQFDIKYMKNLSLKQDFNILLLTVQTVIDGNGK